jgi:membrane-bound serine protease (ClpP class)
MLESFGRAMKKKCLIIAAVIIISIFFIRNVDSQGCETKSGFYVASLNQTIDPGAADFISTSVSNAEAECTSTFILVLNTFGGDGNSMDKIIISISNFQSYGGNFITLISPRGAHAFSAGSYIAEASNKIYMVPGTVIGSATPIVFNIPPGEENTTLTKDIQGFKAFMEALASSFGRNSTAAGLMVSKGLSYTAEQAKKLKVIDGVVNASSTSDALSMLGVPVGTEVHTPGIRSIFLSVISDPNVSGLLFLIGVIAILVDLYHPTVILSVVGIAVIALALLGLGVFGASAVSIALMAIGAAFIFLEVKTHHGISALVGVIIFAVGFLLIFQTPAPSSQPSPLSHPPANFFSVSPLSYALLFAVSALAVIASIYLYRLREGLMRKRSVLDTSRLMGMTGRMETDLEPNSYGTANIGSELWTVTSEERLRKGDFVKVKEVRGLKLVVEKVKDESS